MPKITKRKDKNQSKTGKIHINFDVSMLNALIKYTQCSSYVKRAQIDTLFKLLRKIDVESYNYNEDLQVRIILLLTMTKATIEENIEDHDVWEMYIRENAPEGAKIIDEMGLKKDQLSKTECDTIEKSISERLQFAYLYEVKNIFVDLYDNIDRPGFHSYAETIFQFKNRLNELMLNLQKVSSADEMIREFNFASSLYDSLMDRIITRAKKKSTILYTGIRCLNAMLSPGFEGGREYVFLGGTGKGKSAALLNIADQLRQFNPQVKSVENGMRKTIVYVTMENSINETIERLFDMYNDTGISLKFLDAEEIKRILRNNGKFEFTDNDGIDLDIFYFHDLEISTADIYRLFIKLRDNGKEPIALIVDYILKLDSVRDNQNDERIRLTMAAKELKTLAQVYDIPVITAMQFNREGNAIIDAATRDAKEGILNFVGPSMIGTAWGLVQEADWVGSINLERRKSTKSSHMSFKLYKIRGKLDPMQIDYFNHPFAENGSLRLIPDVNLEKSVSMILSASDLETVSDDDDQSYSSRAQKRPSVRSASKPTYTDQPPKVTNVERTDMAHFHHAA